MFTRTVLPSAVGLALLLTGCSASPTEQPSSSSSSPEAPDSGQLAVDPWVGSFEGEFVGEPTLVSSQGLSGARVRLKPSVIKPDQLMLQFDTEGTHPDRFDHQRGLPTEVYFYGPGSGPHGMSDSVLTHAPFGEGNIIGSPDGTAHWSLEWIEVDLGEGDPDFRNCPAEFHPTASATDVVVGADGRVQSFQITVFLLADYDRFNAPCTTFAIGGQDIAFTRAG